MAAYRSEDREIAVNTDRTGQPTMASCRGRVLLLTGVRPVVVSMACRDRGNDDIMTSAGGAVQKYPASHRS